MLGLFQGVGEGQVGTNSRPVWYIGMCLWEIQIDPSCCWENANCWTIYPFSPQHSTIFTEFEELLILQNFESIFWTNFAKIGNWKLKIDLFRFVKGSFIGSVKMGPIAANPQYLMLTDEYRDGLYTCKLLIVFSNFGLYVKTSFRNCMMFCFAQNISIVNLLDGFFPWQFTGKLWIGLSRREVSRENKQR